MKWIWYIAQTLFIGWFTYAYWQRHPDSSPTELLLMFGMWIVLCAFLTACLTRLWDWIVRRLRPLEGHRGQPGGKGFRPIGTGGGLSKPPERVYRARIGK